MDKDWKGNSRSTHAILGARNYAQNERETNDYYATEPLAATLLMEVEQFSPRIWECACGEGHLAKEFEKAGYNVYATDIVDRGYGFVQDFMAAAAPPCPVLILSRTRHTRGRKSSSNTRLILWTTGKRSLCFSKFSSWKRKPGGSSLRPARRKPFTSVRRVCAVL